jgi:hypothetical protein
MTWIAPKGYALCEGQCDRPVRTGETDIQPHEAIWQCKPSDDCKGDGCSCYLAVIAPGGSQLRIQTDGKGIGVLPPGWAHVCVCLKEVAGQTKESGWSVREKLDWIAPSGMKLYDDCPGWCFRPSRKPSDPGKWFCEEPVKPSASDPSVACVLVGVAPGDKQLYKLPNPCPDEDIPPGWGIFCVCLK